MSAQVECCGRRGGQSSVPNPTARGGEQQPTDAAKTRSTSDRGGGGEKGSHGERDQETGEISIHVAGVIVHIFEFAPSNFRPNRI